jgi:hypothetical protein
MSSKSFDSTSALLSHPTIDTPGTAAKASQDIQRLLSLPTSKRLKSSVWNIVLQVKSLPHSQNNIIHF